jgi:hypothetical protein
MRPALRSLFYCATVGALTARVAGWNGDNFDPGTFGFVSNHRLQFSEGSSVDLPIPSVAEPLEAISDSGQVL